MLMGPLRSDWLTKRVICSRRAIGSAKSQKEPQMMLPSKAPDQCAPEDLRARVMPAALDELARWGVERFSIEAMAARHHIDPKMVYRYWGDRQRLIVDAALADVVSLEAAADT